LKFFEGFSLEEAAKMIKKNEPVDERFLQELREMKPYR